MPSPLSPHTLDDFEGGVSGQIKVLPLHPCAPDALWLPLRPLIKRVTGFELTIATRSRPWRHLPASARDMTLTARDGSTEQLNKAVSWAGGGLINLLARR